jgi:hypothetical protein
MVKVRDIYKCFGIPQNLREHMLRVAKVGRIIAGGWKGEINKSLIIKAGLVHDLANIVKFQLDEGSDLIPKQKEVIEKYGSDDHLATEKMLRELGLDEKIIEMVQRKSFRNAIEVAKGNDWPLKILFYADLRVMPAGVTDLETRMNDAVTRLEKYRVHPQKEELMQNAREVEKQIQAMTTVNLEEINDESVKDDLELLLDEEI